MALFGGSLFTSTMFSSVLFPSNLFGTASGLSFSTQAFDFTSALPSGWSVTRSQATATRRNSDGKIVAVTANQPRFDHDSSGNPLGILIENTKVNKVLANNVNPTGTTGITIISGTGTVTVVDKTAELAAAGLDAVCTGGDVYKITETAGGTLIVQLSDTVGNTNKHSWQAYAYSEGGTTSIDLVGVGSQAIAVGTQPVYYSAQDLTPTATTRYLRATVTNNRTLYIILMDLQEATYNSSVILNIGAGSGTSTRNRDEVKFTSLNTQDWWSQDAGALIGLVRVPRYGYAEQGFFCAVQDSDSGNDQIVVRSISGTGRIDGNYKVNGTDQTNENIGIPLTDDVFACGIMWKAGEVTTFESHGMRFYRATGITNISDTLDTLYLGRTQKFFGYADVHVPYFYVLKGDVSIPNAGSVFLGANDTGFAIGGQSNGEGASEIEGVFTNGGEVAAIAELDNYYTTGRNFISNMAIGGSALYRRNNASNYWLENDGVTAGPLLTRGLEAWSAMGLSRLKGFVWNQGETDASAESQASLKAGWLQVFTLVRAALGNIDIYLMPPGRRADSASADVFYQRWLNALKELADENAFIHMLPNTKVLPLVDETVSGDVVHINDAGWSEYAPWIVRKLANDDGQSVTGPVDGSVISNVSRSGTTVTVTLTHPSGITDFTPTTGIEGFVFEDDGTPITITAAVRTNATTITLTLNSAPTGTEVLMYCYGTGYGLNPANLVKGNDANTMPLQQFKGVL